MILEIITVGALEVNCYVIASAPGAEALIIDPGDQAHKIKKVLAEHNLKPVAVINTHGHVDHIGCDDKFGVPVFIHKLDAVLLEDSDLNLSSFLNMPFTVHSDIRMVDETDIIELAGLSLKVIHIPGHTPGGVALLLMNQGDGILFSGDSLFYRSIGRTDFRGGDNQLLVKSIKEKLFSLPDNTIVYPGHGPATTIGEEKKENPYI